ncbi:Uncharacterised protein [Mycobacteroides abscessus subsp. abscessus]|nr:Uncharacterised protein [Mycobacteroides abscessus subsp. abscessus]
MRCGGVVVRTSAASLKNSGADSSATMRSGSVSRSMGVLDSGRVGPPNGVMVKPSWNLPTAS